MKARPLYCDSCKNDLGHPIELDFFVVEKNINRCKMNEIDPTMEVDPNKPVFAVEITSTEVEWDIQFKCPQCHMFCYHINREAEYDDEEDTVYIPNYVLDSKLGYGSSTAMIPYTKRVYPFLDPEVKVEKLPTIVRPSKGVASGIKT